MYPQTRKKNDSQTKERSKKVRTEKKGQYFNVEGHKSSKQDRVLEDLKQFSQNPPNMSRKTAGGLIHKFKTMQNIKHSSSNEQEAAESQSRLAPTPSQRTNNQIVEHLMNENQNLKQHNGFLLEQVRKNNHKLKKYKQMIKDYKGRITELEHENDIYRLQYLQVKDFVFQSLDKVEEQSKNDGESSVLDSPRRHFVIGQQQKGSIARIRSLNHTQFKEQVSPPPQSVSRQQPSSLINESCIPTDAPKSVEAIIEELNDQFDAMMYEYKSTKNIESRKKCMEIAKRIRQIKQIGKESEDKKKANPENLPPKPAAVNSKKLPQHREPIPLSNRPTLENLRRINFRNSETQNNILQYLPSKIGRPKSQRQLKLK